MSEIENWTKDFRIGIGRATNETKWIEGVWMSAEINGRPQPTLIIRDTTAIKMGLRMLRCGLGAWLMQPTGRKKT